MDIPGTAPSALLTIAPAGTSPPKWGAGQVLNAVVESVLAGDRVTLRIGAALVEAGASGALSAGQRLTLQVVRNESQLLLRVLGSDGGSQPAQAKPAPATATGTLFTVRDALPAALAARPGKVLQAVVSAREGELVTLTIGDRSLEARASQSLALGERLSVQVVQAERPAVLQAIDENSVGETLRNAMRSALPRQLPLQDVFARLGTLSPSGTAPAAALRQLLQALPDVEQLTRGDNFKAAVQDAGQFLEQRLLHDAPAAELRQDLKANLLRLLAALNQTPQDAGDLTRQTEAAVARIQLHQLAAAAPDQDPPAWAGEVPLRHGGGVDVCRLRIERDGGKDNEQSGCGWNTWLSLDLQALGPLHARLTLGGLRISTVLWAESEVTAALVSDHLDTLRGALEGAGLEVAELQCHRGRPPFLPPDRLPAGLLDILA